MLIIFDDAGASSFSSDFKYFPFENEFMFDILLLKNARNSFVTKLFFAFLKKDRASRLS